MPQNPDNNKASSDLYSIKEQHLLLDALYGTLSETETTLWHNIQREKPAITDEYRRLQATMQQVSAAQFSVQSATQVPFTEQSVFHQNFFEQQWQYLQKLMKSEREAVLAPVFPHVPTFPNLPTQRTFHSLQHVLQHVSTSRWYALAAMVLVAIGIGTSLWQWQNSTPQSQQTSTLQGMSEKAADDKKDIAQNPTNTTPSAEQQNESDVKKSLRSRDDKKENANESTNNSTNNNALLKTSPEAERTPANTQPNKPFSDDGTNINKKSTTTQDVLPSAIPSAEPLREEAVPETKPQAAPLTAPILRDNEQMRTTEQMRNSFMPSGSSTKSLPSMNAKRALSTSATQKADTASGTKSPQKPLTDTLRRR